MRNELAVWQLVTEGTLVEGGGVEGGAVVRRGVGHQLLVVPSLSLIAAPVEAGLGVIGFKTMHALCGTLTAAAESAAAAPGGPTQWHLHPQPNSARNLQTVHSKCSNTIFSPHTVSAADKTPLPLCTAVYGFLF